MYNNNNKCILNEVSINLNIWCNLILFDLFFATVGDRKQAIYYNNDGLSLTILSVFVLGKALALRSSILKNYEYSLLSQLLPAGA